MKTKHGHGQNQRYKIGDVVIRTRHKRGGEQRAFVKIAEPSKWILRARFVWEGANGKIPKGFGVHHKDENKLNDALDNLELVSKSKHLALHMPAYKKRVVANLVKQRKARRWSTKSEMKLTGRHPANCTCPIHAKAR